MDRTHLDSVPDNRHTGHSPVPCGSALAAPVHSAPAGACSADSPSRLNSPDLQGGRSEREASEVADFVSWSRGLGNGVEPVSGLGVRGTKLKVDADFQPDNQRHNES